VDRYLLQKDGKVVEWTEEKLRKQLRTGNLDGLELARRPDEERWRPLHDLALFREEVPHEGDPRDVARQRVVRGFAGHLITFAAVSTFFLGLNAFSGIWAIFLLWHAASALPVALQLARERKLFSLGAGPRPAPALPPTSTAALPAGDRFTADLGEVRALLENRPKDAAQPMLEELDRLASSVALLREKIAKLAALTGPDEHGALADRVRAAEAALAEAGGTDELLARRLEVLRDRERSDARALRTLERLRIRESLAEDQLQQLRLDLVRAEADALEPSDLGERLEQIRIEAEAAEDVEGLLAR
jgi:hypothetical protein